MKSLKVQKFFASKASKLERKSLSLAALLIASATFTACSSSDDNIIEKQPVENPTATKTYTMTIQATKGGDAAQTRGLSLNNDGKTLNVKWNEGEVVEVIQRDAYNNDVLRGTLTAAASSDGTTTLTGEVSNIDASSELSFYLHGNDQSYNGQTGVLLRPAEGTDNSIETNYDYGYGSVAAGGFTVSGNTITVTDNVSFSSKQAIVKFNFIDALTNAAFNVSSLDITGYYNSNSNNIELSYNELTDAQSYGTLTVTPATPASSFYVSLRSAFSDAHEKLVLNAVGENGQCYTYEKSNVTLMKGKYYAITVKMHRTAPANAAYVDLGLPSGTKWANMNIGATSVTDRGLYFAWGETIGYPYGTSHSFSWANYSLTEGSGHGNNDLTKYHRVGDPLAFDYTTLQTADDAAAANWGGSWRMPTKTEWQELLDNCTYSWQTDYQGSGMNGLLLTSKVTGYTDKSIFLPADSYYNENTINGHTYCIYYWSSSLYTEQTGGYGSYQPQTAHILEAVYYESQGKFYWEPRVVNEDRNKGMGIRAVQ